MKARIEMASACYWSANETLKKAAVALEAASGREDTGYWSYPDKADPNGPRWPGSESETPEAEGAGIEK